MRLGGALALVTASLVAMLASPATAAHLAPGALADAGRLAGLQVGAAIDVDLTTVRREIAAREFTSATVENSLKWRPLSPTPGAYDFTDADAAVEWAEESGLRIRGHTLFWDRSNGAPVWLEDEVEAAPDPEAYLTELMETHAQALVGRYAGRLAQWDVVNEPLEDLGGSLDPENLFFRTLGEPYLDIAFHAAHAADPDAALFLNETLTEVPAKFEGLIQLVERMLARGVPIDGIGLQGHAFLVPPDPVALQSQLERVASLGLLVELTEVDIPLYLFRLEPDPLAAQAQAYADVVSACVAVSACTGITTWGVDDGDTWLDSFDLTQAFAPNQPLLFDELGQPKPAYDAVVTALLAGADPIRIDIKPGSHPNPIHPASVQLVPVAILGSATNDVADVDPTTLAFGPEGAVLGHASCPHFEDVNGDGVTDLVAHFVARETGIAQGDAEACLSGEFHGLPFEACDGILTLPACGFGFELAFLLPPFLWLHRRLGRCAVGCRDLAPRS
jgi:endo-1,4-beta-xylanase